MDAGFDPLVGIREHIAQYGWHVRHVGAGDTPGEVIFSYTIGLTAYGHPEFVMQGMPFEYSHAFLNQLGRAVRDGERFTSGSLSNDFADGGFPLAFIEVLDTSGLTAVSEICGQVSALQVIWGDSKGHLPWEPGWPNGPSAQPLLGPLPDNFTK